MSSEHEPQVQQQGTSVLTPAQPATTPPGPQHQDSRRRRTRELLEDADGTPNDDTLHEVVMLNLPVARRVAREYRDRGIEEEDLFQVAAEALVKAVRRFRPERGEELLGYAVPTIRGEIRHHFRDSGWQVRPPRRLQELQWAITRASERLQQKLGREPEPVEVCEVLEIDPTSYREARATFGLFRGSSLDEPVTDGEDRDVPRGATLAAEPETPDAELWIDLKQLISALDARDRQVLRLRFVDDLTQQEIGEQLGVTQVTVSRWLDRILGTLRSGLDPRAVGGSPGDGGQPLSRPAVASVIGPEAVLDPPQHCP